MAALVVGVAGCGATRLVGGGTGGETGAGGSAGATGGSSGGAPDAGSPGPLESCDQLSAQYTMFLNSAFSCTPGAPYQCQREATTQAVCNGLCPYFEMVNDSSYTDPAYERWSAQCGGICSAFVCHGPSVAPGVCVAVGKDVRPTGGICVPGKWNVPGIDGGAGGTPDGGESCDQLAADYVVAATAALLCTPGAPNQCQALVDQIPDSCWNCGWMAANDSTAVYAAWQRWNAAGCAGNVTCPDPPPASCNSVVRGTCVAPDSTRPTLGICVTPSIDAGS
jgi:hypothetical protein